MIIKNIQLLVAIALLALCAGCASGPVVAVEAADGLDQNATFVVVESRPEPLALMDAGLLDHTTRWLTTRGWQLSSTKPTYTVELNTDAERVLDVARGQGRRGNGVVTDIDVATDITVGLTLRDARGNTVWAASNDVSLPLGTEIDEARARIIEALDEILAELPVGGRSG